MIIENILSKHEDRDFRRRKKNNLTPGPIVQWVGGKRQLMSRYLEVFPEEINDYYEPFMGGASVFFELYQRGYIKGDSYLSDLNSELVMTSNLIKENYQQVADLVNKINEKHSKELFYEIRNVDRKRLENKRFEKTSDLQDILTPVEIAARLLYLNKTCFNALYRVNKDNLFNVPMGRSDRKDFSDHGQLEAAAKILSAATIRNLPYQEAVGGAQSGDFVYFDPPYEPVLAEEDSNIGGISLNGNNFTKYTVDGFSSQDQVELKECCDRLNARGVKFALSNSNADLILELYKDYNVLEFEVNRTLNSKGENRKNSAKEVLVTNF
jgi:DNA adenine methylase